MTFLYDPHVTEVEIIVSVKIAHHGEETRNLYFTEEEHGREITNQLADTVLSACDLAIAKVKDKP